VLLVFALSQVSFLWYNVIGCAVVLGVALALERAGSHQQAA
jgi:hypothetical protein